MNWLAIVELIATAVEEELPVVQAIINAFQGASASKQAVLGSAVTSALAVKKAGGKLI
jgi:hypothetical protein